MKISTQGMSDKIFFLPVNTGYYCDGNPTNDCLSFYRRRSDKSLYCSIVGNVATKKGFSTNSSTGKISSNQKWQDLSYSIKENGTIPGIQIARTWDSYVGQKSFKNKNWDEYRNKLIVELKKVDISEVLDDFIDSIDMAASNGFEHIQIHAAHGYLLSSLLDPFLYDKSHELVQALNSIASEFQHRLELSIRISMFCGFSNLVEVNRMAILQELFDKSFKFIDLSEGYYNFDKQVIYPSNNLMLNQRLERSLKIAESWSQQSFIISGWTNLSQPISANIYKGFCRHIISNPDFTKVVKHSCLQCGDCHYYTLGKENLSCRRWQSTDSKL
jgi:2,4-dienoyl-CoA reductase-like NADH-dependent reductase (Old Yellow Enzyme family)